MPEEEKGPEDSEFVRINKNQLSWIGTCLAIALVSVLYRALIMLDDLPVAMMFIGIPLVLAIALVFTPRPKSATGVIMKGITLALLLSGILLIEGFVCILMASPLFYLIGGIVGRVEDRRRKNDDSHRMNCVIYGVLALMSFEGVVVALTFPREDTVIVSENLSIPISEARTLMEEGPVFDNSKLAPFLKLGFPKPVKIQGEGSEIGDQWKISFAIGKKPPGDLVLEVVASTENSVTYQCIDDGSHLSNWLNWKTITWSLEEASTSDCTISIELNYDRLLDPAWYFKPIERYGVSKAGEFLISQTFSKNE